MHHISTGFAGVYITLYYYYTLLLQNRNKMAVTDMNVFLASSSYVYILLISSGLATNILRTWNEIADKIMIVEMYHQLDRTDGMTLPPSPPASDQRKNAQVWQRKWLVCHHINEKPIQFYQSRGRLQWSVKHQAVTRPHKHREEMTRDTSPTPSFCFPFQRPKRQPSSMPSCRFHT